MTYEQLRRSEEVNCYIRAAGDALLAMGYTEHSFAHVTAVAEKAGEILRALGYPERTVENARIAGYLHDVGNMVNRFGHSQSGAALALPLLRSLGASPEDTAQIVSAIGNHDEDTGVPVSPVAAALILADKSDMRRSRVRARDPADFDIHDRVNYSVTRASLSVDPEAAVILLELTIDTEYSSVADYFEIFLRRMNFCRRAARTLDTSFQLVINGQRML